MAKVNYIKQAKTGAEVESKFDERLGKGELVIVTKEQEEAIYGYNGAKPVQFNSPDIIRFKKDGDVFIKSGDTLNTAMEKVEGKIDELANSASGLDGEISNIEAAVGLNPDGTHKESRGNYTSAATTIEGEIIVLDTVLKTTNDNLKDLSDSTKEELEKLSEKVSENKVKSTDKSIVVVTDEHGTELSVNLDNATITKDSQGKIYSNLSFRKVSDETSEYSAIYEMGYYTPGTTNWNRIGDALNLGKDMVVKEGRVVVNPAGQPAGTYIELIIANKEANPIYINCKDLVDVYTGTDGISVSNTNVISIKLSNHGDEGVLYIEPRDGGLAITGFTDLKERIEKLEESEAEMLDRVDYKGHEQSFSDVEVSEKTVGGVKYKDVVIKNVINDNIADATASNNGLATALGVKNYMSGALDGDNLYVGTNKSAEITNWRLQDNGPAASYDSIHLAMRKFDGQLVRTANLIGVTADGSNDTLMYPNVSSHRYISGTTNVMGAISAIETVVGALDDKGTVVDDWLKDVRFYTSINNMKAAAPSAGVSGSSAGDNFTIEGSDTVTVTNGTRKITLSSPKLAATGDTYITATTDNHNIILSADVISGETAFNNLTTGQTGQLVDAATVKNFILNGTFVTLSAETPTETNVFKQYGLYNGKGVRINGESIKIYKDQRFYSAGLGKAGSTVNKTTGVITQSSSNEDALQLVHIDANGEYFLTEVNLNTFINESEVKDGLKIENHELKIKIDANSEPYLTVSGNGLKLSGLEDVLKSIKTYNKLSNGTTTVSATTSASTITVSGDTYIGIGVSQDKFQLTADVITTKDAFADVTENGQLVDAHVIREVFRENERVVSSSLNDLNGRIISLSGNTNQQFEAVNDRIDNLDYKMTSANTSTLANLNCNTNVYIATVGSNQTFSLTGTPKGVQEVTVIINNTSNSEITITLSHTSLVGSTFRIPAKGWGEINALYAGGTWYVRAA